RTDLAEFGWLRAWEGHYVLMTRNDTAFAGQAGREAAACGRTLGDLNLQALGVGLEGLSLVSEGNIGEGMRRLELAGAMASGGDVDDLNVALTASCYLIDACSRVRDYGRATQWCERFLEMCTRMNASDAGALCRPL